MLSVDPSLTPTVIENLIKATARAFPDTSCTTSLCGAGVLDAAAALDGAADPTAVLGSRVNTGGGGCVTAPVGTRLFDPLLLLALAGLWGLRRSSG